MVVGPATLVHTKLDLESPLNRLADAVNPFHKVDPSTELECAVGRLPLKDGIAQIDRSIALETKKFAASVSGTLNFREETLDLAIKPQIRQGISIDVPQVASLVRFQGPFRSPAVRIDAVGSATAAAKIGAAIYSGGLSISGNRCCLPLPAAGRALVGQHWGRRHGARSGRAAKSIPLLEDARADLKSLGADSRSLARHAWGVRSIMCALQQGADFHIGRFDERLMPER